MPEITIKYNNSKTLDILKALSGFLDFTFARPSKPPKKECFINGIPVIPGDNTIDMSEMNNVFTGKNIDAKKLREKAWMRNK